MPVVGASSISLALRTSHRCSTFWSSKCRAIRSCYRHSAKCTVSNSVVASCKHLGEHAHSHAKVSSVQESRQVVPTYKNVIVSLLKCIVSVLRSESPWSKEYRLHNLLCLELTNPGYPTQAHACAHYW
ncbi:TPA: hypothetical protein ACH3X1_013936 [Trebouxia sp. C0004]